MKLYFKVKKYLGGLGLKLNYYDGRMDTHDFKISQACPDANSKLVHDVQSCYDSEIGRKKKLEKRQIFI